MLQRIEVCITECQNQVCLALWKEFARPITVDLLQVGVITIFRRFALNYEQTAKCGGEEDFMEGFKKTKGFR
jgi:hypothetical protein